MARNKGQIGLKLPVRSKPGKDSFNVRSGAVAQWLENLPAGNVGETTKLIYNALQEVNHLDISWKERYRFLEQLRPTITSIQHSLARRFIGISFPLPARLHQIAVLSRALHAGMATGYKIALEDTLSGSFLSRDKQALLVMIHRTIHYLSRVLLTSYQTYSSHPNDVWFELHLLYLHAELKGLQRVPVRDKEEPKQAELSIANLYKQILLLALASPYRLRQGEAESVYGALRRWAAQTKIIAYDDPGSREALFVIHMDSDQPPDYMALNNRACSNELCRLIDTSQLAHLLGDELAYVRKHNESGKVPAPNISQDLLNRLILAWGLNPKRQFSRSNKEADIRVVVGITALHQVLTSGQEDELMSAHLSSYQSRSVLSADRITTDDVWNVFSAKELTNAVKPQKEERRAVKLDVTVHNWQIQNESAGGYRLCTNDDPSARIHVGELLGLKPRNAGKWEIGVVRWIRQTNEAELELGVQVLAPEAKPVMVKGLDTKSKIDFQRSLLLPEVKAVNRPTTLITPIRLFQPGNEVLMHAPGEDATISLGAVQQDSGTFIQFSFKSDDTAEATSLEEAGAYDEDFDDLWSEL